MGALLDALEQDGLLDNTVIFLFGDNGRCLLRGKQWLYEAGTHVPLIVRWPGVAKPGRCAMTRSAALDITATRWFAAASRCRRYFHGQAAVRTRRQTARPRHHRP